jgi:fused signal recognition particle receptor
LNIFLVKWKNGLEKTSKTTFGQVATLLGATEITASMFDELEALLIQADVGVQTSQEILESLRITWRREGLTRASELKAALRKELGKRLQSPPEIKINGNPTVVLVVGVNGSGKTTTIAKLGYMYSHKGCRVVLGAADTFRAAAVDQLQIWAERLKLPIVSGQLGGDSAAVTYDSIQAAIARQADLVLIDTAGRLHTRFNLMEELKKVYRVAGKALAGAPHAVWLVLDATTGQNALQQAKAFKEAVSIDGVILAKLDSSARGGMVFAIQQELKLPVIFAGLGEQLDDLQPFDPEAFITGILGDELK